MRGALVQTQALKLKMTPALLQSVKLLQFSNEQLYDYVMEKAMGNPLIRVERSTRQMAGFSRTGGEARSVTDVIEETAAAPIDFRDKLRRQLHQMQLERNVVVVADFLIDSLAENGYLEDDPAPLLERAGFDERIRRIALEALQSLDPAGVGARTLTECLLLQLRRVKPRQKLAELICRRYSDCFISDDWQTVRMELGVSEAAIARATEVIRRLNPDPLGSIYSSEAQYIVPDLTIRRVENHFLCEIDDGDFPTVSIDEEYRDGIDAQSREVRDYLREKRAEARGLLTGISRRRQTLLKIGRLLIERQRRYFETGKWDTLIPFTMKQAASSLSLHESTVSRAVANKYVQTPYDLIPLKKLFVHAGGRKGGTVSAIRIQEKIRGWIDREDPRSPLSDRRLSELLTADGMKCSRRAVAKYRMICGIGSTAKRRKRE